MSHAIIRAAAALGALAAAAFSAPVQFKVRCLRDLVSQVPKILASQDRKTGRFGTGIWATTGRTAGASC
jgi:hypothetical protein